LFLSVGTFRGQALQSGHRLPGTLQQATGTADDGGIDHLPVHYEDPITTGTGDPLVLIFEAPKNAKL